LTRILIVDDDPGLTRALTISLRAHGYDVETAGTGTTGLTAASAHPPDLVIVDLGLPDLDGLEVVHGLRAWLTTPIVILSARDEQREKVAALDAGADDYVTKPFGMEELLARVRAALRRGAPVDSAHPVITAASFSVDLRSHRVTIPTGEVRLTPTEWHLLEILVRHPSQLVTQRQLLAEVWGPGFTTEMNYLRVYMSQLRRKLERDPTRPAHFITDPGVGYRFEP
jgi:two-component system KDP operon response regulator KdpE